MMFNFIKYLFVATILFGCSVTDVKEDTTPCTARATLDKSKINFNTVNNSYFGDVLAIGFGIDSAMVDRQLYFYNSSIFMQLDMAAFSKVENGYSLNTTDWRVEEISELIDVAGMAELDADVFVSLYRIDINDDIHFNISKFDTVNQEIAGEFSFDLVVRSANENKRFLPDTVSIRDAKFHTKLLPWSKLVDGLAQPCKTPER